MIGVPYWQMPQICPGPAAARYDGRWAATKGRLLMIRTTSRFGLRLGAAAIREDGSKSWQYWDAPKMIMHSIRRTIHGLPKAQGTRIAFGSAAAKCLSESTQTGQSPKLRMFVCNQRS